MGKHSLLLIGHGIWGSKILETLVHLGQDVTVVETSAEKRKHLPSAVESLQNLPPDSFFEAAFIATPATTHLQVAESLLAIGFKGPIFVEKPLADSTDRARRLAALASDKVFVLHTWRYHPGILALRDLIEGKWLGSTTFVESRRCNWTSPRRDVDTVWNLAPHDLSLYLALFGRLPSPTAAIVDRAHGHVVGMSAVFEGKPPFAFTVSNRFSDKIRLLRVHFEQGVACFDAEGPAEIQIAKGSEVSPSPNHESLPNGGRSALENQFRACLQFLEGGPAPPTSAEEGIAVVQMIEELRSLAGLDSPV
ncbi:MAG: Gfo/Idh/MocA family oxidoreductase [Verrucomicrobiia bacterium]